MISARCQVLRVDAVAQLREGVKASVSRVWLAVAVEAGDPFEVGLWVEDPKALASMAPGASFALEIFAPSEERPLARAEALLKATTERLAALEARTSPDASAGGDPSSGGSPPAPSSGGA